MRTWLVSGLVLGLAAFGGCKTSGMVAVEQGRASDVPVIIQEIGTRYPNSAGGVDVRISFVNASEKTIKYIYFFVDPYNRVGDKERSEIGRKQRAKLEYVGPIKPGGGRIIQLGGVVWSNVWYNSSIRCTELKRLKTVFMDGTERVVEERDIHLTISKYIQNSCQIK